MKLRILSTLFVSSTLLVGSTIDGSSPCPTAPNQNLQHYIDNYGSTLGGTCTIGSLKYYNFAFAKLKVDSSSVTSDYPINASNLIITPDAASSSFGILPSVLTLFNRPITLPERYLISYTLDPPPIIAGDELFLDPPSNSSIYGTKWGCVDSTFTSTPNIQAVLLGKHPSDYTKTMDGSFKCDSNPNSEPYFIQVDGLSGNFSNVRRSVFFDEPAYKLDVKIILDFQPGNITGFDGTLPTAILTVPEPTTTGLIAFSLLGAALLSRRNRKL